MLQSAGFLYPSGAATVSKRMPNETVAEAGNDTRRGVPKPCPKTSSDFPMGKSKTA